MYRDIRTLQPDDTLATAVDHILSGWQQDFPVVYGKHVLGVLTRDGLVRHRRGRDGQSCAGRDAPRLPGD